MKAITRSRQWWLHVGQILLLLLLIAVYGVFTLFFSGEFLIIVKGKVLLPIFLLLLTLATLGSVIGKWHKPGKNPQKIFQILWSIISIAMVFPIVSAGRTLSLGAMGSVPTVAIAILALPFLGYALFFLMNGALTLLSLANRKSRTMTRGSVALGIPFVILFVAFGFIAASWSPQWSAGVEHSKLFNSGDETGRGYRIPSMLVLPGDNILAFAESRQAAMSDLMDINIVLKRSADGGLTWKPLQVLEDQGKHTVHNPTALYDSTTEEVWLAFCVDYLTMYVTSSDDKGVNWSSPVNLSKTLPSSSTAHCATGPGSGIQLSSGRLVFPVNTDHPRALYSDNHGATWKVGGAIDAGEEPQMYTKADGTLCANLRNGLGKARIVTCSANAGSSWEKTSLDMNLKDAGTQAAITRDLQGGLLFSNPAAGYRAEMTLRMSSDDGATWPYSKLLYKGAAGYSQIGVLSDGTVLVLFETGRYDLRESITLARLKLGAT